MVTRVPHLPESGSPARRGSPAPRTTRRVFRHTWPRPARRRAGGPPSGAPAPACGYPGSPAPAPASAAGARGTTGPAADPVGAAAGGDPRAGAERPGAADVAAGTGGNDADGPLPPAAGAGSSRVGVGAHTPGRGGGVRARRAATATARMVSPAAWSEGAGPFERERPVEWVVAPVTPGSNEVTPRRWTGRGAGGPGAARRRRPPRGPRTAGTPSAGAGAERAVRSCQVPGAGPAGGGCVPPHLRRGPPRAAREGGRVRARGAATAGWRPGRGRRAAPSG